MRNLPPDVISKWTSCNARCDLSDFAVPTTDTAPWGEAGHLVRLTLRIDPGALEPYIERTVLDGVWDRSMHALAFPMPTRREPWRQGTCGLHGLIRVTLQDGWMEHKNGFVIHGRCLLEDEEKLTSIVTNLAAAELGRLVELYSTLRDRFQAPLADNPGPR